VKRGTAFVPEDRRIDGLTLDHSVLANTILSIVDKMATAGVVFRDNAAQVYAELNKG
jgi:ribose transport system ATP-binding protein